MLFLSYVNHLAWRNPVDYELRNRTNTVATYKNIHHPALLIIAVRLKVYLPDAF
jgi:hypothetical protein